MIKPAILEKLHEGTVIPAHPLALTKERTLDEAAQRALTRYYIAAGAGGVAVGVHTTQFEIREPAFQLYETVLTLAIEEIEQAGIADSFIKIGGVSGETEQAIKEATFLKEVGYDLALVSMGNLPTYSDRDHLDRIQSIATIIPVFGFYLQPAVGGRIFPYDFWREFAEIPSVYAIKVAPFDRYYTLDVMRAVVHSKRNEDIAIYTGNDDNIVADLLTDYQFTVDGKEVKKSIVGGLLGHWAVWTKTTVDIFNEIKKARNKGYVPLELLKLGQEITDANAAFFDPYHKFQGSIAGINEVLTRQGLLKGRWCLLEKERLSPGQIDEIDRVYEMYPHLNDDDFVKKHLDEWVER